MRKSNILCKSLATVESLGAVNVICSDKTGTLTQNIMSVVNISIGKECSSIMEAREKAILGGKEGECVRALAAIAGLCNDASFDTSREDEPPEVRKVNGDATGMSADWMLSAIVISSQIPVYYGFPRASHPSTSAAACGMKLQKSRSTLVCTVFYRNLAHINKEFKRTSSR